MEKGTLPATGKLSPIRLSNALATVVDQPPPLSPTITKRSYPCVSAKLIARLTGSTKNRITRCKKTPLVFDFSLRLSRVPSLSW
jgi:hypothetical protein